MKNRLLDLDSTSSIEMAFTLAAVQTATQFFLGQQELSIDNWTFKLFYKGFVNKAALNMSAIILVASSVLVSCNQFFGEPIVCDLPGGGVSEKVLKSYCWMYSSFNIPPEFEGECARRQLTRSDLYNSYYQWIPIVLIVQSFIFYVPRVCWLMMEGGLMKYLAKGRTGRIVENVDDNLRVLLKTFRDNLQNKYRRYFIIFLGCECLNFAIVALQFVMTDAFLRGHFLDYGWRVFQYYRLPSEELRESGLVNPMCEAFPRVASCNYFRYGSGGRQEALNAICILGLNILIDKIYLILWFWFLTVGLLGALRLLNRLCQLISPTFRYHLMRLKMHRYFKSDNPGLIEVREYIVGCDIGDWFVLYQMSKNLNRRFFYDFLIRLSQDRKTHDSHKKQ